jgi:uncharacterized protein YqgC (DUF456 family)
VELFLYIVGLLLLLIFCMAAGFTLIVGLPGTVFLVLIALFYGWATGFAAVTGKVILWLAALAAAGEGFELFSASLAVGGEKPSRRVSVSALAGAVIGGLVGTPFLFGVGSLIGALIGAFLGATIASRSEGRTTATAMYAGVAAMRGRLLGFVVKAAIAVVMMIVIFAAAI